MATRFGRFDQPPPDVGGWLPMPEAQHQRGGGPSGPGGQGSPGSGRGGGDDEGEGSKGSSRSRSRAGTPEGKRGGVGGAATPGRGGGAAAAASQLASGMTGRASEATGMTAEELATAARESFNASRLGQAQAAARARMGETTFDALGRKLGQVKEDVVDPLLGPAKTFGTVTTATGNPVVGAIAAGVHATMSGTFDAVGDLFSGFSGDATDATPASATPAPERAGGGEAPMRAAAQAAAQQPAQERPKTPYEEAREKAAEKTPGRKTGEKAPGSRPADAGAGFLAQAQADLKRLREAPLARLGAY